MNDDTLPDNVPEKICKGRSKSPSSKKNSKEKEGDSASISKEKKKEGKDDNPRTNAKDISGKGQRYYLYEHELKRPTDAHPGFRGGPRGFRGGRLPFHMHDYHGIYPTNEDAKFERELQARRAREHRIYSRPADLYYSTPRSPPRFERSERYDHDRRTERRGDYDSYRHYEGGSSRRHWDDQDRDSYHHRSSEYDDSHYGSSSHRKSDSILNGSSRDYHSSSSTRRRRHSYEESGRSRTGQSPESSKQPNPKEKERNDFDLDIELHPLMHFIDDKPKLLKEALSILKGRKLDAMIPHIFSHLNPREVEEVCLQELNTLNIATIANVIDGKFVNAELANPPQLKTGKSKDSGAVSVKKIKKKLKEAITEDVPKKKKRKVGTDTNPKSKKLKKDKKHKKKKKKSKQLKDDEVPLGPGLPPQKTLMELLELEYRAKAIKALLKSQDINSLSSEIDDALLGNPEPTSSAPSNELPSIAPTPVIEPPAPPEINTRFLVDNTYIYPMQIKLELEDPLPDDLEEGQFPPSPPQPPLPANPIPEPIPSEIVKAGVQIPVDDTRQVEPCPLALPRDGVVAFLVTEPRVQDSHHGQLNIEPSTSNDPPASDSGQTEGAPPSLPSLTDNPLLLEQSQEELPLVPVSLAWTGSALTEVEVTPEMANNVPVDLSPPRPRIPIVITLGDDTSSSDEEIADSVPLENVQSSVIPCSNGELPPMETEPVESEESEIEEGEYGDEEEKEAAGLWREKGQEWEVEEEAEEEEEEDEEEPPMNTYVRRSSDLPVISKAKDRDESPPRLSLVKIRPEMPTILTAFPETEDISSDESSGLEPLPDDGIIIGGDPVGPDADDDPIKLPPVHTCEPRPEGYEEVSEDSNPADEEGEEQEEEEEDEETNPRTWFNRWYNSKKVQRNVKSNKMIGKLRSKLRREKAIPEPLPPEPSEEAVPIIGSITEYQTLFSSGKYKALPETDEEKPESAPEAETDKKEAEEEAEDDDALWGDIIG